MLDRENVVHENWAPNVRSPDICVLDRGRGSKENIHLR